MFVAVAFITISIIFAFQQSNIKYIDEIDSKINLDIKEYKDINDKFLEQDINLIFSWPKIKESNNNFGSKYSSNYVLEEKYIFKF